MPFLTPKPTPATQPFWDGLAEGRLMLQREVESGRFFFYPRPFSPFNPEAKIEWAEVSGNATLHSYIINHRPVPGIDTFSPIIALVKLVEGPVLTTNIVGIDPDPEKLILDMPLRVQFRQGDGTTFAVFTPAQESTP